MEAIEWHMAQLTRRISFIRRSACVRAGSAAIHSASESWGATSAIARRAKACRARSAARSVTAARDASKPTAWAHRRYGPGSSAGKTYSPSASVNTVVVMVRSTPLA